MKEFVESFLFGEPLWALLFFFLPLLAWIKRKFLKHKSRLLFPTLSLQMEANQIHSSRWTWLPLFWRIMALVFVILALCRPQLDRSTYTILSSGVDIVLAVDLSASMLALDMSESDSLDVTRLDVVKDVLKEFIEQRKNDRIGLVAFSVDPYLVLSLIHI